MSRGTERSYHQTLGGWQYYLTLWSSRLARALASIRRRLAKKKHRSKAASSTQTPRCAHRSLRTHTPAVQFHYHTFQQSTHTSSALSSLSAAAAASLSRPLSHSTPFSLRGRPKATRAGVKPDPGAAANTQTHTLPLVGGFQGERGRIGCKQTPTRGMCVPHGVASASRWQLATSTRAY